MKFDNVTQQVTAYGESLHPLAKLTSAMGKMVPLYSLLCRVCSDTELEDTGTAEVLSDQRLATRSVEKSTGIPGDPAVGGKAGRRGLCHMKFTVADLKLLRKMVSCANAEDEVMLTRCLQKKQPAFLSLIQDVAIDPRCAEACRYCTLFCGLALEQIEVEKGESFSLLSESEFLDIAGQVVRQDKNIGRRAMTYPKRISKHVLATAGFDHEDSGWLCMMIATFLITIERFFNNCND